MSGERLQILKMVEEGKVSAEEATSLLDALGNGKRPGKGRESTYIRGRFVEGKRVSDFSVRVGLARWILSWPLVNLEFGHDRIDADQLVRLINSGATGKVLEFTEGDKKLEIWLDF